jgi:hypothetical protein
MRSASDARNVEIICHEQHGLLPGTGKIAQQIKEMSLGGDVQGRGRLIGDQELGARDHRHGDQHALALPARNWQHPRPSTA